jgi:hypothetical protein
VRGAFESSSLHWCWESHRLIHFLSSLNWTVDPGAGSIGKPLWMFSGILLMSVLNNQIPTHCWCVMKIPCVGPTTILKTGFSPLSVVNDDSSRNIKLGGSFPRVCAISANSALLLCNVAHSAHVFLFRSAFSIGIENELRENSPVSASKQSLHIESNIGTVGAKLSSGTSFISSSLKTLFAKRLSEIVFHTSRVEGVA